eukprot:3745153-Amphidinium_carterae.1
MLSTWSELATMQDICKEGTVASSTGNRQEMGSGRQQGVKCSDCYCSAHTMMRLVPSGVRCVVLVAYGAELPQKLSGLS